MKKELLEILCQGAEELGVGELTEAQASAFSTYLDELKRWNSRINLTAIRDEREIVIRHFIDSLVPFKVLSGIKDGRGSILDIGAGGGFPGLPLKVVLPEMKVTLVDSVEKKVNFMRHAIRTIGLADATAVAGRAEDPAIIEAIGKGGFDCVISRALTELGAFVEMARPYLNEGGIIIAMKGPLEGAGTEASPGRETPIKAELKAVESLEYEIVETSVPFAERVTTMVIFRGLHR